MHNTVSPLSRRHAAKRTDSIARRIQEVKSENTAPPDWSRRACALRGRRCSYHDLLAQRIFRGSRTDKATQAPCIRQANTWAHFGTNPECLLRFAAQSDTHSSMLATLTPRLQVVSVPCDRCAGTGKCAHEWDIKTGAVVALRTCPSCLGRGVVRQNAAA